MKTQRMIFVFALSFIFYSVGCKKEVSTAQAKKAATAKTKSPKAQAKKSTTKKAKKNIFVDINSKQAQALLKKEKGITIIDVRTPGEYGAGHLANAKNINLFDKAFMTSLKALDKNKTYLVHCAVGGRSRRAVGAMKKLGFRYVYHMADGYRGWVSAQLPVVK